MEQSKNKQQLWTKNFILITAVNLLLYTSWQMFPSAFPPYLMTISNSASVIGLFNGVATIATLAIRPFAGIVMDKYGRRGIFALGLVLLALSTAAFLFAPAVGILMAVRFFHGLSWGIASTASNTVASDNINKTRISEGMAYFSLSVSLSSAISPALGLSLKISNMIIVATVLIVLAFIVNLFINYGKYVPAQNSGQKSAPFEKSAILPAVLMFLITLTYGAILTFIAIYARQKGIENIGLFFTLYAIAMLITRPMLGKLAEKRGFTIPIVFGAIVVSAALLILSRAESYSMFLVCGALYGIGYGALHTSLQTLAVISADKSRLGAANATFFFGFDGGIGAGAIIAGVLAGRLGHGSMYAVISICPLLVIILYFLFSPKNKKEITHEG